jgi:hypothetical protein
MLERLELAQAVARAQTGSARAFLQVEDWRPLLGHIDGSGLTRERGERGTGTPRLEALNALAVRFGDRVPI